LVRIRRHHAVMLRLAAGYVPSMAVAEEVVQDTWLGVLRGIGGFEGRSSVRTWVFRILVNRARTAGTRERRSVAIGDWVPAVDQSRFDATGHWTAPPERWVEEAENRVNAAKLTKRLRSAVGELPVRQREVVLLRDVEGLSSEEVCGVLEISEGNQRVLLHRARSRLRQVLETEFGRA
jgi:RNA polymerase sigma-70 factor (ECF subfamily)